MKFPVLRAKCSIIRFLRSSMSAISVAKVTASEKRYFNCKEIFSNLGNLCSLTLVSWDFCHKCLYLIVGMVRERASELGNFKF